MIKGVFLFRGLVTVEPMKFNVHRGDGVEKKLIKLLVFYGFSGFRTKVV